MGSLSSPYLRGLSYLIVPEAYRSDETVDLEAPEGLLDSRSLLEGLSVMPGSEKEGRELANVAVTVVINLPFTEGVDGDDRLVGSRRFLGG